jgi:hypothetical protein
MFAKGKSSNDPPNGLVIAASIAVALLLVLNGPLAILVAIGGLLLWWLAAVLLAGGLAGMWQFGGITTSSPPDGSYVAGQHWSDPFWELWWWLAQEWNYAARQAGGWWHAMERIFADWLKFDDAPLIYLNGFTGLTVAGMLAGGNLVIDLTDPVKRQFREGKRRIKNEGREAPGRPRRVKRENFIKLGGSLLNPVGLDMEALRQHLMALGTTGTGKTTTILAPVQHFIDRGFPVVYVDAKGESALGRKIIGYSRAEGRETWFCNMNDIPNSATYGPLSSGSFTSKADRLISLDRWSEDYYKRLAIGFLQTVFKVLEACQVPVSLPTVADYLSTDALLELTQKNAERIGKDAAKALAAEIASHQGETEKHAINVRSIIHNLIRSDIGGLFRDKDPGATLSLTSALRANAVVYFGLCPLVWPEQSRNLGKLIINDLKATLAEAGVPAALVVFDEFGVFAGEQILNFINQGRSFGANAILTAQSLADIGRSLGGTEGRDFVKQVLANVNTYIAHRLNEPDDAKTLAELAGTRPSHISSWQTGPDNEATGMGNVHPGREFRIHPDQVKALPNHTAVILDKTAGTRLVPPFKVAPCALSRF